MQVQLLASIDDSGLVISITDDEAPNWAELRRGTDAPELAQSETERGEPTWPIPNGENERPGCAELWSSNEGPGCEQSDVSVGKSRRLKLLSNSGAPDWTTSETDGKNTGPRRDKPDRGTFIRPTRCNYLFFAFLFFSDLCAESVVGRLNMVWRELMTGHSETS